MQSTNIAEVVEEITKSLQELKELSLDENPTVSDYADALPAVLFYAGITGKADSLSSFGELIDMNPSHVSRTINRKLPEQAPIKGRHGETPYVSIYKAAMRGLELPDTIDPRFWTRSYHILAETMVRIAHGAARIELEKEHAQMLERYSNFQTPGVTKPGLIGMYRGLVDKLKR